MNLRPYQLDLIDKTRALMKEGCKSILIQSPTGSGKTLLTAHMLHTAASKGMRSWFVVHRKELIDQSARAFKLEGLEHGIIAAGYGKSYGRSIQLASIQTLAKRFGQYRAPSLIVWDECHHIAASSWKKIYEANPNSYHIGLSATPQRLDGKGLVAFFEKMVNGPSVSWLIENGFLSKYRLYAPASVDLSNVHKRMGDYAKDELTTAVDKPKITGSAVEHYKKYAAGKRAIVFAVSVEHSKHIVEEFQKEGFNAEHVDGETPQEERARSVERFREGNTQILSNVELFSEGFDLPSVEVAILLRPTQSLGLYLQQCGRSLRPFDGKQNAILLDHVGNVERFGLPDQDREWSLECRDKSKGEYQASVRICPFCFGAFSSSPLCPFCGAIMPLKSREIETVSGDLKEIDEAAQLALKLKWKKEQGMQKGYSQLVTLAKERNYKKPEAWAAIIMKSRQAKKLKENV